ncbi:MAG: zinc ribbon domain-containing protein [Chloroflexota bacterium]|nr:zinc ribbon domain-containing protein [Chloroflexota bacterium]
MPLYEYYCSDCDKTVELLMQSFEVQGIICPHCGGANMEKQLSSYNMIKTGGQNQFKEGTCCGRKERCETPPCSTGERCHRK